MHICGAIIGPTFIGTVIDDVHSHINNFKQNNHNDWMVKYDVTHNIGVASYFNNNNIRNIADIDIYHMIKYILRNSSPINVYKLSLNNTFSDSQINHFIECINNDDHLVKILLIRNNQYDKIISKCTAVTLFNMGHQTESFDVKKNKHNIEINTNLFQKEIIDDLSFRTYIEKINIPKTNIFYFEEFFRRANKYIDWLMY